MGGSTAARGHGGAINKRKVFIAVTFEDAGAPPSRHVERTVDARGRGALLHRCPDLPDALRRFLGSGPILDTLPPRSKPFDRSNVDRETTRAVEHLQTNSHGRGRRASSSCGTYYARHRLSKAVEQEPR
jgi:hypothetical protein